MSVEGRARDGKQISSDSAASKFFPQGVSQTVIPVLKQFLTGEMTASLSTIVINKKDNVTTAMARTVNSSGVFHESPHHSSMHPTLDQLPVGCVRAWSDC